MRRITAVLVLVLLLAVAAWADNAKRIAEIESRQKDIIVEIGQHNQTIVRENQAIADLSNEFQQCEGRKAELRKQDEDSKKKGSKT